MQGIYIHIPFCHRKCGYCDFNSYAGLDALVAPFVDALHREIEQSPYAGARFDTVFFGGGTPTYLDGATLAGILEHLTRRFAIAVGRRNHLRGEPWQRLAGAATHPSAGGLQPPQLRRAVVPS
jgi:coproporphyrinogen III oxidase-like Fe-S oxidoreductase